MKTDKNIICALIVTEPNRRNLFVYYLPVTDKWKAKVMSNNISEDGNKLQMRDKTGNPIYTIKQSVKQSALVSFRVLETAWRRNVLLRFARMLLPNLSKRYGAKRGESTSLLKYTTPEQAARFKRCKDDEYDIFKNSKGIWV